MRFEACPTCCKGSRGLLRLLQSYTAKRLVGLADFALSWALHKGLVRLLLGVMGLLQLEWNSEFRGQCVLEVLDEWFARLDASA